MDCRKKTFSDLPVIDRNIINGIPWAENMWATLENGLNRTFLYWCQIVFNIGENEDVTKEWADIFLSTYEDTSCELVTDMERVQNNVLLKIEQLLKEFEGLCQTLHTNMPVLGDKTRRLSLHQEQEELIKRIDEYKKIIQVRRAEVDKLLEEQSILCKYLGMEPKEFKDNPLPSCEEIDSLKDYIAKLETEKFCRLDKFLSVKKELVQIISETNFEPSSQFEKDVLSLDDSSILLTDDNMNKLVIFQDKLIRQQKEVREEIAGLRIKLDDFWNLLDVDGKEREDFQEKHYGNSLNVLHALQMETKRCEGLKKANIKVFIEKLRDELEQLWNNCHCSEMMKTQFGFFYADCYTEALLELHEMEVVKWKNFYEENKELLTLLEKHRRLWYKLMQLDENDNGPNRYNNRGGQLLKEEKERNRAAKQIPQIEETLYTLAEKYERLHKDPFTSYGTTVPEYLANLHEEKENAKQQKLSARKMKRDQQLTPAKSAANLFPTNQKSTKASTPQTNTKRKLATPVADETKKIKVLSERKHKTKQTPVTTNKITVTVGHTNRLSIERKKRIDKIRRRSSKKKAKVNSNATTSTDYGEFQNELVSRSDCRSTLLTSEKTPTSSKMKNLVVPTITVSSPKTPSVKTPIPKGFARTPDINVKSSAKKFKVKLF